MLGWPRNTRPKRPFTTLSTIAYTIISLGWSSQGPLTLVVCCFYAWSLPLLQCTNLPRIIFSKTFMEKLQGLRRSIWIIPQIFLPSGLSQLNVIIYLLLICIFSQFLRHGTWASASVCIVSLLFEPIMKSFGLQDPGMQTTNICEATSHRPCYPNMLQRSLPVELPQESMNWN